MTFDTIPRLRPCRVRSANLSNPEGDEPGLALARAFREGLREHQHDTGGCQMSPTFRVMASWRLGRRRLRYSRSRVRMTGLLESFPEPFPYGMPRSLVRQTSLLSTVASMRRTGAPRFGVDNCRRTAGETVSRLSQ
jgi:hypothetical protein